MTSLRQKVFLEESQKDFLRRRSRKDIDIDAGGKCNATASAAENKYIFMRKILLIACMGKFKVILVSDNFFSEMKNSKSEGTFLITGV